MLVNKEEMLIVLVLRLAAIDAWWIELEHIIQIEYSTPGCLEFLRYVLLLNSRLLRDMRICVVLV